MSDVAPLPASLDRHLARKRGIARVVLAWERLWPALFPAVALLGVFVCLALLDVLPLLPPTVHGAVLLAFLTVLVWLLRRGLRTGLPGAAEADRRLELRGGQRHRPLATLTDRPAPGTGDDALWEAHLARLRASLQHLRVGWPRSALPVRDRRALRILLLLALVACLVVAGPEGGLRLRQALLPTFPPAPPPLPTLLQAWLTPPAYTGLPPILLNAAQRDVTAPAGSRLTAAISGGPAGQDAPIATLAEVTVPIQRLDQGSWQAAADLSSGGTLLIRRAGAELGRWELTAVADVPPEVRWSAPPSATGGRLPQLRVPWQVSHPYGVTGLHAELVLRDRPRAPPLIVELPLPGNAPHQAHGVRQVDLTAHPWAGLPVTAVLVGQDTGGLTGRSDTRSVTLPARKFQHPVARAIVGVRQMLALHPEDRAHAAATLAKLAQDDSLWPDDPGGLLNMAAIAALLADTPAVRDPSGTVLDEAQDRLWILALHLEEGLPARTAEALAKARHALHNALDRVRHPQAGDKHTELSAELARRQQDLARTLERHFQALQQQAKRDPQHAAPSAAQQEAARRALQQLREAEEAQQFDQAQQKLSELDQTLDDMERERRRAEATPQQRRRSEARQRGRDHMGVVQDLVRREGQLLDHAQARAAPAEQSRTSLDFPPGQGGLPNDQTDTAHADADVGERAQDHALQHALRRAIGVLMQAQGDATGSVPPPLNDADRAMHDAQAALAAGQDQGAADAERRAIAALQEGGRAMSQQLTRMGGRDPQGAQNGDEGQPDDDQTASGNDGGDDPGQGQGQEFGQDSTPPGEGTGGGDSDPFGRATREGAAGGTDDGGETAVPETMEQARTRVIQDELRRRAAERSRPQRELDYIGRLLDTK